MHSKFLQSIKMATILNPLESSWEMANSSIIDLMPTPAGMQPTQYIRTKWSDHQHGSVSKVKVKSIYNQHFIAFRLNWYDPHKNDVIDDTDKFVDAAAIMVSTDIAAPLVTMGSKDVPVDIWHWKADVENEQAGQVVAKGLGTTTQVKGGEVRTSGVWHNNHWHVVIARPLDVISNYPLTNLGSSNTIYFAVAIWDGANQERGGLKSVTFNWQKLLLSEP